MNIKQYIKKIIKKFLYPNKYSSDAYIDYLRKKGIQVGKGCIIYSPNRTDIDIQRPHMLKIGDYVRITSGVTIIAHDYSRSVLCNLSQYGNVGEADDISIGNNVFIGVNSIILMGTHIGENCIIGAGSVVSGFFEDNVVIAGNPARVICTLDTFYKKRKQREILSAKEYVRQWKSRFESSPTIDEMTNAFSWLYLPRNEDAILNNEELFKLRGVDLDLYKKNFLESEPAYESFEAFLRDCNDNEQN